MKMMESWEFNNDLGNISKKAFADEKEIIRELAERINLSDRQLEKIQQKAEKYAQAIRGSKDHGVENFIQEYSLTSEEGVAVMCLAEALLRIPDNKTANELIEDKLQNKNWKQHLGKSDTLFVNAASWGLFLTGKVIDLSVSDFSLTKLIGKIGEPVLLPAIKKAIHIISNEFIMGENIAKGKKNAVAFENKGYRMSYDILGESSRNAAQADFYYYEYLKAVKEIADRVSNDGDIYTQPSISIKLSALHPRFELLQVERVEKELLPRVLDIVRLCADSNIAVSFDAEEASRLDIYLYVLTQLISNPELKNYNGIGFVVQAYQKRASYVIDYIIKLAKDFSKKISVRLVKGAYWDSEIKNAQEQGLEDYPVYTVKEYTDISYLACARKMLNNADLIYSQFATHNAYTAAAIEEIAENVEFEFQKLHGMGAVLHEEIRKGGQRSRIYSPVGQYKDLLAYLMRRLLENGANTSFINMVKNKEKALTDVVKNPIEVGKLKMDQKKQLMRPLDIFGVSRMSSQGYELGIKNDADDIIHHLRHHNSQTYKISSLINGKQTTKKPKDFQVRQPASLEEVAVFDKASVKEIKESLDHAHQAFESWSRTDVVKRAGILNKFADLLHENRYFFYSLLIREAGKNIKDSIAEVREAIDFARYYAHRAQELLAKPLQMPSYTGEASTLSMHGRGVFVCISPWNFPLAIFAGQVLAALVTGNTVIAKPAELTPVVAYEAVRLMYKAGVPDNVLHMLIANGSDIGKELLQDHRIAGVCFTGSTGVARTINRTLAARDCPISPFIAETGGQNAMIVDSSALLEQATDSIINSAFGSMGQRCSALRVLYVQEEIYNPLIEMVIGAMNELMIGNTIDFENDLGPVISEGAKNELLAHIEQMKQQGFKVRAAHKSQFALEKMPGYYLAPHIIEINKISDIKKENFGPILHVKPFASYELDKVIDEINSTGYGLTFGIHSRIMTKIHDVTSNIKAGNMYANRSMIGAQVESHPFGGEGNSGTGFKAGGPNYLLRFMLERTLIVNTTAIGGNVELLSQVI